MIFEHDDFSLEVKPNSIVVYLSKVDNSSEGEIERVFRSLKELGLNILSSNVQIKYAGLSWSGYLWTETEGEEIKFSILPPVGRLCSDCGNSSCPRFARREEFLDSCVEFTLDTAIGNDDVIDDDDGFWF